ncbi:hypothetical protein J6590_002065 [Homalodisca vitripennis]|nr:hypothetical protein J6590_002065 [Homalodisca vitripennis]
MGAARRAGSSVIAIPSMHEPLHDTALRSHLRESDWINERRTLIQLPRHSNMSGFFLPDLTHNPFRAGKREIISTSDNSSTRRKSRSFRDLVVHITHTFDGNRKILVPRTTGYRYGRFHPYFIRVMLASDRVSSMA